MSFCRRKKKGGYTIIELGIVVLIFILLTAVVLASNSRFGGNILSANLAYEIGLAIREAQVYGISVHEFQGGQAGANFDAGYGVHFDKNSPTSFILFADADKSGMYDGTPAETLQTFTIGGGNTLKSFCGVKTDGTSACSDAGITFLDISFVRPNPDAHIMTSNPNDTYGSAVITIESKAGQTRLIKVFNTGQISIP